MVFLWLGGCHLQEEAQIKAIAKTMASAQVDYTDFGFSITLNHLIIYVLGYDYYI